MKKKLVYLYLVHFLVLHFAEFTKCTGNVEYFRKQCPNLLNYILDNKIENYTINCQFSNFTAKRVTEETVLQYACFLAENIVTYICENNLPINSEQLSLLRDSNSSICSFDFNQIRKLKSFEYYRIEKELMINDHCEKVCYDLYEPKNQCVILKKVNNFVIDYSVKVPVEGKLTNQHDIVTTKQLALESRIPVSQTEESQKTTLKLNLTVQAKKIEIIQGSNKTVTLTSTKQVPVSNPDSAYSFKVIKSSSVSPPMNLESTSPGYFKPLKEEIYTNAEDTKPPTIDENEDFDGIDDTGDEISQGLNQVPDPSKQEFEEKTASNENPTLHESFSRSEVFSGEGFNQQEDSHFFFYFLMLSSAVIIGYLAFHNKNKIVAYALEGSSGRRSRRRPNPARYRKLETNLEEAITSNVSQSPESSVVY